MEKYYKVVLLNNKRTKLRFKFHNYKNSLIFDIFQELELIEAVNEYRYLTFKKNEYHYLVDNDIQKVEYKRITLTPYNEILIKANINNEEEIIDPIDLFSMNELYDIIQCMMEA